MVHIKPQFSGLLSSITIALAVGSVTVDALPQSQGQPRTPTTMPSPIESEFLDLATRAPLMRRGGGGSGSSRARMMRQLEAAQIFEASRLAHAKMRREQEEGVVGNIILSSTEDPGPRADVQSLPSSWRDLGSHSDTSNQDDDLVAAISSTIPHRRDEVHSESHKRHHHHHHPERPNDYSKGGHSEHWFEHHAHDPDHRAHHHHHHDRRSRSSRRGPSRLAPDLNSRSENEFVAPASVRVKSGQGESKAKGGASPGSGPSRMVKKPKSKSKSHAKSDWTSKDGREDDGSGEKRKHERAKDHSSYSVRRDISTNSTQSDPRSEPPVFSLDVIDGTPGVLDLVSSPVGQKLGGLSVTSISPGAFVTSANDTSLRNATALEYLIDSTPNPAEQTTFYLREFDDQSLIHSEQSSPTPAATQAVQDLLVSLEVPLAAGSNSTDTVRRMCATFNPLAQDVQTFGLSLCMDEHEAKNDGTASQAFRFSPDTGVVQPFYGIGGAGDRMLEQVNARIEQMGAEAAITGAGGETLESNSTVAIPDLVPVVIASSINVNATAEGSISDSVPSSGSTNATTSSKSTLASSPNSQANTTDSEVSSGAVAEASTSIANSPVATTTLTPTLSSSTAPNDSLSQDALVIGDLPPNGASARTSSQGSGNHAGLMMVFRRVGNGSSRPRTRDNAGTAGTRRKRTVRDRRVLRPAGRGVRRSGSVQSSPSESSPSERVIYEGVSSAPPIIPTAKDAATQSPAYSSSPNSPSAKSSDSTPSVPGTSSPKLSPAVNQDDTKLDPSIKSPLNSNGLNTPLPKPVVNVAYFGDSGRSAPVPPEDQAENTHPILVADHGSHPQSSKPVQLAAADAPEPDVVPVYLMSPNAKSAPRGSTAGTMATAAKSGGESVHGGGGSNLPVDASD